MRARPTHNQSKRQNRKKSAVSGTATSRVHDLLKHEIMSCQIAPGEALYEGELAARLGVSKTPVREALSMLIQEGFVELRSRQGYRVTDLTLADIQEMFHLRLLLEPAAAELAAERASAEQLKELQMLADESYVHGREDTYSNFIVKNRLFHMKIAEASGSRRLAKIHKSLLEEMARLFYIGLELRDSADEQVAEHKELLDALLKGNHHLARDISARQIETSRKRIIEGLLLSQMNGGAISTLGAAIKLGQSQPSGNR